VRLSGNSDDPNATYEWVVTPPSGPAQSYQGQEITLTVEQEGTYQVRLTVTAGDGVTKNEILHKIEVYPPGAPMPVLTANHASSPDPSGDGVCGYRILFDASHSYSSIPGVTITNFKITYGDGYSESNSTGIFDHSYPNPTPGGSATYTANLEITDSNGEKSSTSIQVSVWGEH